MQVRKRLGPPIEARQWFTGDEPLPGMERDETGEGWYVPSLTDPRVLTPVNHGDWIIPVGEGFEVVPDINVDFEPVLVGGGFDLTMHYGPGKVWVRRVLKGRHREHCLCYSCDRFKPEDREKNCRVANLLYELCRTLNIVIPVWECPKFEEDISK